MSTCAVCGAALDREWVPSRHRGGSAAPIHPAGARGPRSGSRNTGPRQTRTTNAPYSRAYRAEVRAHTVRRAAHRASAIERTAAGHIGAARGRGVAGRPARGADRALVRNRDATSDGARGYAQARLAHSDERVVQTTSGA